MDGNLSGDKKAVKSKTKIDEGVADVSHIENQYWQAKDTDFQVVQNRLYTKEKRYSVSLSLGPMINDQFSSATAFNLNANYYFTERWGVEVNYQKMAAKPNSMTDEFVNRFAVVPNHNQFSSYIGVGGNWVPVYSKASLIDRRIMYFDIAITPGLGIIQYEQQFTDKANEKKITPALALDLTQQVFITRNWTVRLAYMIRWFKEETRDSRAPFDTRDSSMSQTNVIMLGMTYFY